MPIIVEKRPGLGQRGTRLGCIQEGLREEEDCISGMGGGIHMEEWRLLRKDRELG